MTIEQLVVMAERIHNAEGWKLGAASSRETRNAFWARVIGCAYWGHPTYNLTPDTQWHLKKADPTRPQTDDIATSMPSRNHWDCIPNVGTDNYWFEATFHGALPSEQIVYAPPKPDGSGSGEQPQPPIPQPPAAIISRDEFYARFRAINDYYAATEGLKRPGGMVIDSANPVRCDHEAMGKWGYDLILGKTVEQAKAEIRQSDEWKQKHPGETP